MNRLHFVLSATILGMAGAPAAAQNFNWTGANSQPGVINDAIHWSNPYNWNPQQFISPGTTTTLTFNADPGGVTSTNDLGAFVLNGMTFNTGITIGGNSLNFQGGVQSYIMQTVSAAVTVSNNLTLNSTSSLNMLGSGTGTVTLSGVIGGNGSLIVNGGYTTILSNSSNGYSGGTTVAAGTLAIVSGGGVIPAGGIVTVGSGATFNYGLGLTINNSGSAIGTLALNGGTFRVSGGSGDFYLNKLTVGVAGGTVNFSGAAAFFTHLTGAGAGITVNGNSTWTAGAATQIQNDTSATIDIAVNNYSTLTNGIALANGTNGKGFRLTGTAGTVSTMILTNPGNTADLTADSTGYLQVTNMANLGSGVITLQNTAGDVRQGTIRYDGGTANSGKTITLGVGGGQIYVTTPGANLTLFNTIVDSPAGQPLLITGYGNYTNPSVVTLPANNTFSGKVTIAYGGVLSVPSIPNGGFSSPLGASSSSPANLQIGDPNLSGGTLQYTGGTATTNRGLTVVPFRDSSFTNVNAIEITNQATILTVTGQVTGNGSLMTTGQGQVTLTNTANNYTGGTFINGGSSGLGALGVPNFAVLGSGGLTFQNLGRFHYSGPTATLSKPIVLDNGGTNSGGQFFVDSAGANLTLSGVISETGGGTSSIVLASPSGGGTFTLTNTNTYTGSILINNCVVSIATFPNGGVAGPLGASPSAPDFLHLAGTLQYTGPTTSTNRGVTLFYGTGTQASAIEVTNAATNLTMSGQLTNGALTKIGPGTLTLTNATSLSLNNYTGGTFINAGRLAFGDNVGRDVIPANTDVTVAAGAELNTGHTMGFTGVGIGTLTLNGGALRGTGPGAGWYFRQIVTGTTGGTVEFTGGVSFLDFYQAGAAIVVNGNSSWTGPNSSYIFYGASLGQDLPITVAPNVTLTSGLTLQAGPSGSGFHVSGGGTLYLTTPTTNAANITVGPGTLRVDDVTTGGGGALGNGALTLDGGTLQYSGSTAATGRAPVLGNGGGTVQVDGTGVNLTLQGQITGVGSLTKTGLGTLTLTNTTNNYAGGTVVTAGTLAYGASGGVIPLNSNVTVASGAALNLAGFGSATPVNTIFPIGTLTLNGGALRASIGSNDLYLNKLVTDQTGGTVDLTGSFEYLVVFVNSGAGIAIAGNSSWIDGNGNSLIQNGSPGILTIGVTNGATLMNGLRLFNGPGGGYRLSGTPGTVSTMILTNPGNTADLIADSTGYLEVPSMTNLGSGIITLQNTGSDFRPGTIRYDGGNATSNKPITLGTNGSQPFAGQLYVYTAGANLTLTGVISEAPPGSGSGLLVTANGQFNPITILTLAGANTYTGPTTIAFGGYLSVASIPNGGIASPLGMSSNSPANLVIGHPGYAGGTLQYTGPNTTTDRGVTLVAYQNSSITNIDTIEVANAATNLTFTGQFVGNGGLTKTGLGTLTLANAVNTYTGGTFVSAGMLALGNATAMPTGGNITVQAGAVFNTMGLFNYYATAIGTLTLNGGGTIRIPSGAYNGYHLNYLTTDAGGGTVDMTGTTTVSGFGVDLVFAGPGAGITINGNSSWIGPSYSYIQSASGAQMPLTVAAGVTLTSSLTLSGYPPVATNSFLVNGGGTLYLTQPAYYLATIRVNQAILRMDYLSNVAPGLFDVTLDNGTLLYSGATTSGALFTLTSAGGTIGVSNAATTLTITGAIPGVGPLTKIGAGTLVLGNSGNAFSGLTISAGTLLTANDNTLGAGSVTINPFGTLRYTASTNTARTFTLYSGALETAAGQTLTINGGAVGGGFMRGPGTFAITGGSALTGATTSVNAILNQTGSATYSNFTNGGAMTISSPAPAAASFSSFTNQGSGSITVTAGGQVNAADFQTSGLINLAVGAVGAKTLLTNVGGTPLYFNGGSRTFIGVAGGNVALSGIELNGQNAIVAGGLFVNNGQVTDNSILGISTVIADYGALVKGGGQYDNSPITRNGGKFQAGNSPGVATMGRFVFGPGGVSNYVFAIDDATGQAGPTPDALGHVSGWGLVKAAQWQRAAGMTSGDFAFTADASHPLSVAIDTLVNPTTVGTDVSGLMADFDSMKSYSWPAVEWTGTYSGPTDVASLDAATNFDTSGFANPITGTFGWRLDPAGQTLSLTYAPSAVPEPGTLALLGFAATAGWWRRQIKVSSN